MTSTALPIEMVRRSCAEMAGDTVGSPSSRVVEVSREPAVGRVTG